MKRKRWIFSRKRYYHSDIKNGSIIKVEGSYWAHTKDGDVVTVNGLVGKVVGDHQMLAFGNRRKKTIPGICSLADNDIIRIRVK